MFPLIDICRKNRHATRIQSHAFTSEEKHQIAPQWIVTNYKQIFNIVANTANYRNYPPQIRKIKTLLYLNLFQKGCVHLNYSGCLQSPLSR